MMIDGIQRLVERRGFVLACKKAASAIAFCAVAAGVLMVFSPLNGWLISTAERVKPIQGMTWRAFIDSFGIFAALFGLFVLYNLYPQKLRDKAKTNVLYICIAGILAVFTWMAYVYGRQWLDSDMASEMILGNMLAKENRLVTPNWVYSTELRLVYQQLFYMPLFKLSDDWRVVRTVTTLLNNIVLLASYFFMMRQFAVSKKTILLTSLFLILPVSMGYFGIVLFGGYYLFFIAMFFCYIGLAAILLKPDGQNGKTKAAFILLALRAFVQGAGGIRALMDIQVPVFLTALFARFTGKNTKLNSKPFLLGVTGLALGLAGYAVNFLLHFFYKFHSHHGAYTTDLYDVFFRQLGNIIYNFMLFLGYVPNAKFMSPQGILNFASVAVLFLIFYGAAKIIKNRGGEAAINVSFALFFIVSTVYHTVLYEFINDDAGTHLLPSRILYIPALAIIFEYARKNMPRLRARLIISGIAFAIICNGVMRLHTLPSNNANSYRKDSIAYIEENNLRFGFATFWNSNIITELTNGRIEMFSLHYDDYHKIHGWLYPVAYENPGYHNGETFLLMDKKELEAMPDEKIAARKPDYEDDRFVIFRYPSSAAVFDEVIEH
jgi:hypothetical protein